MTEFNHIPVLLDEVLEMLTFPPDRSARLIDGTVGGGGHSAALLKRYEKLELLGIDRDASALEAAAEKLAFAGKRVTLVNGNYSEMSRLAAAHGWDKVDAVLLDIGVSSPQIDRPERGFSWRAAGPLDMRMNRESELTAARLLNRADETELARIFREYGEIPQARKLAAAVVARREVEPFALTTDLVAVCDAVLGNPRHQRLPAPTLPFQALRIAVNDELGELKSGLGQAVELLRIGGIAAVISFHSLEDREVKNYFRRESTECLCPPGLPVCCCGHRAVLKLLTRKALTAAPEELAANRRSAPAKLRAVQKIRESNEGDSKKKKTSYRGMTI